MALRMRVTSFMHRFRLPAAYAKGDKTQSLKRDYGTPQDYRTTGLLDHGTTGLQEYGRGDYRNFRRLRKFSPRPRPRCRPRLRLSSITRTRTIWVRLRRLRRAGFVSSVSRMPRSF